MKYNILAVGAHPDDVELGAFGTLIKWSKNTNITIAVATNGEAVVSQKGDRAKEAKAAATAIGADIVFLGLQDGFIQHNLTTVSLIDNLIKKVNPDIVLIHHPDDLHQDHRHLSLAGISAARRVKQVLFYETPSTTKTFNPNFYVNVTEEMARKYEVLGKHESQAGKSYFTKESVYGIASYHALSVNRANSYCEAFQLHRNIVD